MRARILGGCLAILGLASAASATPVGGGSTVLWLGSSLNNFSIWYQAGTGAPGLYLESVQITLAGGLFFDTTGSSPGFGGSSDVAAVAGAAATGFHSITPEPASGRNGSNTLTLGFSDFEAGELFSFNVDVDRPSANNAFAVDMAGSTITATFGGAGWQGNSFTGAYQNHFELIPGISTGFRGEVLPAPSPSDDTHLPEPVSMLLAGGGLLAVGLLRRWRGAR